MPKDGAVLRGVPTATRRPGQRSGSELGPTVGRRLGDEVDVRWAENQAQGDEDHEARPGHLHARVGAHADRVPRESQGE